MTEKNLEMRRGDLKPDLIVDLNDNGVPIDTTTATTVSVLGWKNNALLFKRAVGTSATGVASMAWQASDTLLPGTIEVEVEIIWPAAKPQTIRMSNKVVVMPDFG